MVPKEGLMSLPMKVVAGCGSRSDLGLMRNTALHKRDVMSWTCRWRIDGEDAMRAMSSRYWTVCGCSHCKNEEGCGLER